MPVNQSRVHRQPAQAVDTRPSAGCNSHEPRSWVRAFAEWEAGHPHLASVAGAAPTPTPPSQEEPTVDHSGTNGTAERPPGHAPTPMTQRAQEIVRELGIDCRYSDVVRRLRAEGHSPHGNTYSSAMRAVYGDDWTTKKSARQGGDTNGHKETASPRKQRTPDARRPAAEPARPAAAAAQSRAQAPDSIDQVLDHLRAVRQAAGQVGGYNRLRRLCAELEAISRG